MVARGRKTAKCAKAPNRTKPARKRLSTVIQPTKSKPPKPKFGQRRTQKPTSEIAKLKNLLQAAEDRQTATAEILKVIAESPRDTTPVFEAIASSAKRLLGGFSTAVFRVLNGNVNLAAFTPVNPAADAALQADFPQPVENFVAFQLAQHGEPIAIADTEEVSHAPVREIARLHGFRSMLWVPMVNGAITIGIIAVTRAKPGAFAVNHIQLLQTFADQAVIAIENVRLFDEVKARTRDLTEALKQQTATSEVLQVISSSPGELEPVFKSMLTNALRICHARFGNLLLFNGEGFILAELHNAPAAYGELFKNGPLVPGPHTGLGRLMATKQVVHIADVQAASAAHGDPLRIATTQILQARSFLAVPMMKEKELIGAIIIYRQEVRPFSDKEIKLVSGFASQAVIAIEGARLLKELRERTDDLSESLQQQTATSEVLSVISSSAGDLIPVFDAMLGKAMQLCGADFGVLNTFDAKQFHTAATRGLQPAYDEYRRSQPLDYGPGTAPARLLQGEPIVEIYDLRDSEAYRRGEPNRRALVDLGGARSVLAVPLLKNDQVVGNVMIFRQEPARFSDKQISLLKHFAAQAVVAIENTRLLRELRASTEDLRELLQQQTATADVLKIISRSAFDLDTVLETLISTAVRLCNCGPGQIFRREGDVYRYAASRMNVDPDYLQHEQTVEIKPGQGTLIGRVALSKRTVMIADAWSDPEYMEKKTARVGNVRAMLGVPLLRDGEPIGAFALARSEPIAFTEREVELVTSFADQAVVAIENARLFNEVQARTKELSASLDNLRIAQDRLVQTEKLASLGQLTAGIAHEIKNPLNFVNNFSALSAELIDELDEALALAPLDQKMRGDLVELTQLLKSNLEKVVQHGKRADSIVKNMLLHSREGSGEQRPADINALLDESLNLAYHGARAEKSGFNITMHRDFDLSAGAIEVFPQEITRAFLNLISNGFYAASKRKTENGDSGFEPVLSAATRNLGNHVEIRIRDNGTGIPTEVKAKIFNPFFTTKPAGEGTGLGLSMTHDIIVKQHGGRIDVETEPGQFTEFTIVLPRKSDVSGSDRGKT